MSNAEKGRREVGSLYVDTAFFDFVEKELLPAIDAEPSGFWPGQSRAAANARSPAATDRRVASRPPGCRLRSCRVRRIPEVHRVSPGDRRGIHDWDRERRPGNRRGRRPATGGSGE